VVTFILTNVWIFRCFLLTRNQQHSRFPRELYSVVIILLVAFQWQRAAVTVATEMHVAQVVEYNKSVVF